jgi:hypothetical protein
MLASFGLMTPTWALAATPFALVAIAFAIGYRRSRAVRTVLGLAAGPRTWLGLDLLLIATAGLLLALACAQPALWRTRTVYASRDAEAALVFDVSRSMLASSKVHEPNRLQRARRLATRIRTAVPSLPIGLVTLTDRPFPLAFPDTDVDLFRDSLAQAVRIEEPPPRILGAVLATDFRSLQQLALGHYFRPTSKKRAFVILTDGETEQLPVSLPMAFRRQHIQVSVVRFWHRDERVWGKRGRPEAYRPNDDTLPSLERFVAGTGGKVYEERGEEALTGYLTRLAQGGERVAVGKHTIPQPIAPYLVVISALPLGALVRLRSRG